MTVREAVTHFAKVYEAPRDPEETIALVGLGEKADARTKDLSGGQRRRLDLALALIGDPELIFLDEPTTGFDPAARRTAWGVVQRLKDLGKTVLLTTHYLEEAQELADRVAIVKDGRIVAEGPPDSLGPDSSRYRVSYLSEGRRVEHQTDDPTELLHRLTRDAIARGERLDGLEVTRPTLEEVYLELTAGAVRVSPMALTWQQFRFERKLFWRNPSAAFFNFLLPLLLLFLTATAFSADSKELEILIPGIAGMSVVATTFTSLAFNLTVLREDGVLKRWRGTPMPAGAYLGGLLGSAALNAFIQVLIVVTIGNVIYGVEWPEDPVLLLAFTTLGVICFASLGVAFSHLIPNQDAAPAYTNAVFLPVIFISGVFYSSDDLPEALKAVAEALPLKHLIDGLSAGIVGGGSDTATSALVVGAWARGRAACWRCASFAGRKPGATAAARARVPAASARARASRAPARTAGSRSAVSGPARPGGPPRARPRSRALPAAPAAAAS